MKKKCYVKFNQIFDLGHRASILHIQFYLEDRIPSLTSNSILDIEFHLRHRASISHIEFYLEDRECARMEFDVRDRNKNQ